MRRERARRASSHPAGGRVIAVILLGCTIAGVIIHLAIVRPFLLPLTQRIPTGAAYRASLGAPRR